MIWFVLFNLGQGCPIFPKLVLNYQISWSTTPYHNLNIGPDRRLISDCVQGGLLFTLLPLTGVGSALDYLNLGG